MVILQQAAQTLPTFDRGAGLGSCFLREDQLIVEPLVIAFEMIMGDELLDRPPGLAAFSDNSNVSNADGIYDRDSRPIAPGRALTTR